MTVGAVRRGRPGRRGPRMAPVLEAPAPWMPRRPDPTLVSVAGHLAVEHLVPASVLDEFQPEQLLRIHVAEHKFRTATESLTALGHTHLAPDDKGLSVEDQAHATDLRMARDGKLAPARLNEFLDRAAYAAQRRQAGQPLSAYDRRSLEVAQVVAHRSVRLARRRGAA